MNTADRHLCFEFLMKVTNRSKEEAQQFMFTLPKSDRARLLRDAKEWKASGSPVRDTAASVLVPPASVSPPEAPETPSDASHQPRKKPKKVLFSLLMPPSELEALRSLSDETGETVSFHIRQAIRLYLKEVNND